MGLLLVANNADYSTSPVGHVGLGTTITSGLQSLFELRRSASKSSYNSVLGGAPGTVIGSPTFNTTSDNVTPANYVLFPSKPVNGGLTFAFVVKMKTGGTINDNIVTSNVPLSVVNGAAWSYLYNRRVAVVGYSYASNTPPLTGYTALTAFLDYAAASDGTYEMFFGVLEDTVSVRIYNAKAGLTNAASATGRYFGFDTPARFRTTGDSGGGAHDESMFAHWNRVLSVAEMDTFYAEMKAQFGAVGLSI